LDKPKSKKKISPLELAKILKISPGKFAELVSDGQLPKGRIGEDGRRFYNKQDVDFIMREWKTQTTGRFLMYTLPLMLVLVLVLIMTIVEIKDMIEDRRVSPTPTVPFGFGAPPEQYYAPGTEWPTATPAEIPTAVYETIENYRQKIIEENRNRDQRQQVIHDEDRNLENIN